MVVTAPRKGASPTMANNGDMTEILIDTLAETENYTI